MPKLPKPGALEPVLCNKRSHRNKTSHHSETKPKHRNEDRAQPKFNFLKKDSVQPKISAPWKKSYDKLRQHIKKQRHYLADKGLYSQNSGFPSSHVWM